MRRDGGEAAEIGDAVAENAGGAGGGDGGNGGGGIDHGFLLLIAANMIGGQGADNGENGGGDEAAVGGGIIGVGDAAATTEGGDGDVRA
jgi:hypothetical protein